MFKITTQQATLLLMFFSMISSRSVLAVSDVFLNSFSDNESVLNFEIDGVSVLTPIEKVTKILAQHGWQEIYKDDANLQGDGKRLRFVKGNFIATGKYKLYPEESRISYELTITDFTSRNATGIYMTQQTIELKGSSLTSGPKLNADVVDKYARALKDTVCNGIKDTKEHREVCPPSSLGRPVSLFSRGGGYIRLIPLVDDEPEQIAVKAVHEKSSASKGSGGVTIMHIKRPQ